MSVKIRLKRLGKIRAPHFRVVIVDSRAKRDGRVIEEIGHYVPTQHPSHIDIESERAQYWLSVGAQPSNTVRKLLELTGDWARFKGEGSTESRVEEPEPKPAFVADENKRPVLRPKNAAPAAAPAGETAPAEATAEA